MSDIVAVQAKLLEMFKWFHSFCVENCICYYAAYGTMLGAVRHKGFVPWDDDLDVVVPRPDYERLKQLMSKIEGRYVMEFPQMNHYDYAHPYAKIYDTSTTLTEKGFFSPRRGLYIDVYPIDGAGNSVKEAKRICRKVRPAVIFMICRQFPIKRERGLLKNVASIVARCVPFVNESKMCSKIDNGLAKYDFEHSKYTGMLEGSEGYHRGVMEKRIYGVPTEYRFEDITIFGPECADEYLTEFYGDWRTLPPIEQRYPRHDFIEFDLNKPYTEEKI